MIKRFANIMLGPIAFHHMMAIVNDRPIDLNIETTSFCPSSCVFCPNKKLRRPKKVMEMGLFEKICEDYYHIGGGALGICSMQSDLLSDDLLFERLQVIKKYRNRFRLYANTTLFGASKFSDSELAELLDSFDTIDISIGGMDREEYKSMYGIDAFDTVIEQLFRLQKIKKNNNSAELGLQIRTNDIDKTNSSQLLKKLKETFEVKETRNEFFSWGGIITGSDLPSGASLSISDNTTHDKDCVVPWSSLSVNVDGIVTGCGCVDWKLQHPVGDMRSQSIKEIWGGSQAKEFRTSFSRKKVPELCRDCALYTDINRAFGRLALINYKPMDGLHCEV